MNESYLITTKGKIALDNELNKLIKIDREEVKKAIAEAREHGDLKENSEYHAAKEKQSHLEGKILELQSKLNRAKVVDPSQLKGIKIFFGATVSLIDIQKESTSQIQIVGEDETDSELGKISWTSPLAKALIGKEEGDEITVHAPKGELQYEIKKVIYK